MIGDLLDDVEAGRWAGCKTVLLTTGKETEWKMTDMRWPDLIAENLARRLMSSWPPTGRMPAVICTPRSWMT